MRPGEPRGEQNPPRALPLPTSFLTSSDPVLCFTPSGAAAGGSLHMAMWSQGAAGQGWVPGCQPLRTRERRKAITPGPIWPCVGLR